VKTAKISCGKVKPISFSGSKLPASHFAFINRINARA